MKDKELDFETINLALNGDKAAIERVLEHYSDYIDSLANGDEDIKQQLALKLIESLPEFKNQMDLTNNKE